MALVAYYILDGNGLDSSDNSNDVSTNTDVSFMTQSNYIAAYFNNSTSRLIVSDDSSIQNIFAGGGSVMAWLSPDSDCTSDGRIAEKTGWSFYLQGTSGSNARAKFRLSRATANGIWRTGYDVSTSGSWTHVAVVYDSDSTSNDPSLYVNGESVTPTEEVIPQGAVTGDSGDDFYMGDASGGTSNYDGYIREVRLYDTALSASDVLQVYQTVDLGYIQDGPAGTGTKTIATRWPVTSGLVGGTTKTKGRQPFLIPHGQHSQKSTLALRHTKGVRW